MRVQHKKIILLSSIGGALEFFDFTIYALFASYISQAFFPQDNALVSLIKTFAVFALGYLARPLGGIVFGHFGDQRQQFLLLNMRQNPIVDWQLLLFLCVLL